MERSTRTGRIACRAAVVLAVCLFAAPALFAAEPEAAYRIVRPEEEAHRLLPKTCRVCHKEDDKKFFVVTSPTDEGLKLAEERLLLSHSSTVETVRINPHSQIVCLFCHMSQPSEGQPALEMEFRTSDGSPAGREDIERLCKLCHPKGGEGHARLTGDGDPSPDFVTAGLASAGREPRCSACHDMHLKETGPNVTTQAFQKFAEHSVFFNPHGRKAGCAVCHPKDMSPQIATPIFLEADAIARCERCHPGGHANIHPVKVAPSEKTYPMEFLNYPMAPDGTMTCSTCHDEPCLTGAATGNRSFLRGGPYVMATDVCYRCHPKAGKGGLDPHVQTDAQGNVIRSSCIFCHVKSQKPETERVAESSGTLGYFHSSIELCVGCHDVKPHPSVNHSVEMRPEAVDKLHAYEKRHAVRLPLEEDSRIVCVTCHNPHAKGVLEGQAALGAGEEHRWRVPSFGELCTPCHNRFD
jgi:hypothetical protein